jgi:outer membrane protein assembly factor BamA
VYRNIKQISREIGFNRIAKETIRRKIPINEVSQYDLDNALIELVNAGYLLMFKNYTEFEIALQSLS